MAHSDDTIAWDPEGYVRYCLIRSYNRRMGYNWVAAARDTGAPYPSISEFVDIGLRLFHGLHPVKVGLDVGTLNESMRELDRELTRITYTDNIGRVTSRRDKNLGTVYEAKYESLAVSPVTKRQTPDLYNDAWGHPRDLDPAETVINNVDLDRRLSEVAMILESNGDTNGLRALAAMIDGAERPSEVAEYAGLTWPTAKKAMGRVREAAQEVPE